MLSRTPNNNVGSINRGVRFRLSVDIDCKENLDSERMESWCLRPYPVVIINIRAPTVVLAVIQSHLPGLLVSWCPLQYWMVGVPRRDPLIRLYYGVWLSCETAYSVQPCLACWTGFALPRNRRGSRGPTPRICDLRRVTATSKNQTNQ